MRAAAFAALVAVLGLAAACQATSPDSSTPAEPGKSAALLKMEHVATAAHRCWFASGDPGFRGYSFANELNSFSGRPRFLLVPKGNFGGMPLLVVEARGTPARVDAFGPLMADEQGERVAADIRRWASGGASCA